MKSLNNFVNETQILSKMAQKSIVGGREVERTETPQETDKIVRNNDGEIVKIKHWPKN